MSEDLQPVADALAALRLSLQGCSDSYCVIRGRATGQHTNGGCRCLRGIAELGLLAATLIEPIQHRCGIVLPPPSQL